MISLTGQSRKVKHPQKGQDQWQVLVDQVIDSLFDIFEFVKCFKPDPLASSFSTVPAETCSQANVYVIT